MLEWTRIDGLSGMNAFSGILRLASVPLHGVTIYNKKQTLSGKRMTMTHLIAAIW